MPLKVTLKPEEKILIGSSVLCNGPAKAELVILNKVPVLREKDILTEEEADTVAKKIYFAILNMYVEPESERVFHDFYFLLLRQMIGMNLSERALDLMMDMSQKIIEGDHYKALRICKKLIDFESEVQQHGE